MKTIQIIVILTLIGCSSPTDRQTIDNPKDSLDQVTSTNNHETWGTPRTSGDREYLDSANYHIIRGKYISGNKFIEVYENKLTKLDRRKEYYENGQLKEEGIMTNANHIYVGVWKYYSTAGKLDSIIDYDKKYPISYFDALKIAEKKGFKMPDVEVTLQVDSLNTLWQIASWAENKNHSGQTAESILINTKTGKVTKPKHQLMSIY
jgi:antitoxin component YwqK of YwqJK toxin-antitoxin module